MIGQAASQITMTFSTHFSTDDCKAKLAAAADTSRRTFLLGLLLSHKEMLGIIDNTTFQLRVNNHYFRYYAPIFYGRFVASQNGTIIQGDFRSPFAQVQVFVICWFSGLGLFALVMLVLGVAHTKDAGEILLFIMSMAAFGIAYAILAKRSKRSMQRTIIAFLKSTLEANDAA
jgi:hypothetical protein